MDDCLFCKIAAGEIPSTCVLENDRVFAFRDIAPQAPVHILVIPKRHVASVADLTAENLPVIDDCFAVIPEIAAAEGLENGYRVISNVGPDAGQTVRHLHFHLLGGKRLADQMA